MHVFCLIVFEKCRRRCRQLANSFQALENRDLFGQIQNAGALQSASVGTAGSKLVSQQSPVKIKRTLPTFKSRIQRLPETASPHLHCAPSDLAPCLRAWARDRDGRPRMRMKPAASFW